MRLTILAAGLFLAACSSPSGEPDGTGSDTAEEAAITAEPAAAPATKPKVATLEAGRYCYLIESDTSTEGLEIEVSPSGVYSGRHFGTVHDEAAAYYTAFETALSHGAAKEEMRVDFQTYTEVDGDTQTGEDSWVIRTDSAHLVAFPDAVMASAPCETLAATVWPPIEE